jgi:hypothetical protein
MKLIIDISEEEMKYPANIIQAVKHGIPLDKIRAEIEQEYKIESEHPYGQGLRRALEIIDKYKEESER